MKLDKNTMFWFMFATTISCYFYAEKESYDQLTKTVIIIINSVILISYVLAAVILNLIGKQLQSNHNAFDAYIDFEEEVYDAITIKDMNKIIREAKTDILIGLFVILSVFLYAYILTDDVVGVIIAAGATGAIYHGLSMSLDGYNKKLLEKLEDRNTEK